MFATILSSMNARARTITLPGALLALGLLGASCATAPAQECDCASRRPAETTLAPTDLDHAEPVADDAIVSAEHPTDWSALADADPAELERLLALLEDRLEKAAPEGWEAELRVVRNRLPFQWEGRAGSAIEVSWSKPNERRVVQRLDPRSGRYVRASASPQFVRYLYYSLDAGFGEPKNRYIRPDRIYGITRDFVVIQPSDATGRADYAAEEIRPLFDRAFGVSEAATREFSVRLGQTPSPENARKLARRYGQSTAAVIADPGRQSDYQLWVRTLHDIRQVRIR